MLKWITARLNKWVVIGALGMAVFLCVFWWAIFYILRPKAPLGAVQPAQIAIIAAPTVTPSPAFDPTVIPDDGQTSRDGISLGTVVQIGGTAGAGLRLRTEAGISSEVRFIGMDAEVFEVREGPKDQDDIVWWYLVSPYDETRSGWAASNYLSVVEKQP